MLKKSYVEELEVLKSENENLKNQNEILFKAMAAQSEEFAKVEKRVYLLEEKHSILLDRINRIEGRK